MTISYSDSFRKILCRWKGSLWKACWKELLCYLIAYYTLGFVYRFAMTDEQKSSFEQVVVKMNGVVRATPITFLLGFYVTSVFQRWMMYVENLTWPEDVMTFINYLVPDSDDVDNSQKRKAMARYLVLANVLCWRDVSEPVRYRFPTIDHLVKAKLMTDAEKDLYEQSHEQTVKWLLPIAWVQNEVQMDKTLSLPPPVVAGFLTQLNNYRGKLRKLYCFDWVGIPLVYTQVAALVTYAFIAMNVVARQYLDPSRKVPGYGADLYIPIMGILELWFYVGWYKVAKYLMRPLGDDDDDLELSYLIDRNLQVALSLATETSKHRPSQLNFSGHKNSVAMLPHTAMSIKAMKHSHPPKSNLNVDISRHSAEEYITYVDETSMPEKLAKVRPF